jgi:hypothetical protein
MRSRSPTQSRKQRQKWERIGFFIAILALADLWFFFLLTTAAWIASVAIHVCAFFVFTSPAIHSWLWFLNLYALLQFFPAVFLDCRIPNRPRRKYARCAGPKRVPPWMKSVVKILGIYGIMWLILSGGKVVWIPTEEVTPWTMRVFSAGWMFFYAYGMDLYCRVLVTKSSQE